MSDGFSTTLANALLNVLEGTAPTTYTTIWCQIHTADPGTAGTTSVSAGSSTRSSFTFGAASAGVVTMSGTPSFTNGGTSETITDISVWSASTSGTFLFSVTLSASKAWTSGETLNLTSLTVTLPTAS
jgi:hypothetical protein